MHEWNFITICYGGRLSVSDMTKYLKVKEIRDYLGQLGILRRTELVMVDQLHFPNLDSSEPNMDLWEFPIRDQLQISNLLRRISMKYIDLDHPLTFKLRYFYFEPEGVGMSTFDKWFRAIDLETPLVSRNHALLRRQAACSSNCVKSLHLCQLFMDPRHLLN